MSRRQADTVWLGFSIFSFFLLSASFLLMPLERETATDRISVYTLIAGLMFWLSMIMGIITQCVLAHHRRMYYATGRIRKARSKQNIGLISFFKNKYAAVADIISAVSLIGLIIALLATHGTGYVCYIVVSLFVFSFSMHCILNGKIFFYIANQ